MSLTHSFEKSIGGSEYDEGFLLVPQHPIPESNTGRRV